MKLINKDAFAVCVIVFIIMMLFQPIFELPGLHNFKDVLTDFSITDIGLQKIREDQYKEADTNIIIVNINSLKSKFYPAVINLVNQSKSKVIGLNISEHKKDFSNQTLDSLQEVFPNLVFTSDDNKSRSKSLLPIGFDNSDRYKTIREFELQSSFNGKQINSFPLEVLKKYDKSIYNYYKNLNYEKLKINYRGGYKQFYFVEVRDIFEGNIDEALFNNKIVLLADCDVKDDFKNLKDLYFTPINPEPVGRSFPDMYLTEIQANIISMLINKSHIIEVPTLIEFLIGFLVLYLNLCFYLFILNKNKMLYDLASIILFLVETFLILYITILMFRNYNTEAGLTITLFAIALGLLVFELYNESFKPLFLSYFQKSKSIKKENQ